MKRLSKKIVSILLSVLTLVSIMPMSLLEVGAVEEPNGLELNLSWTNYLPEGCTSTSYVWDCKETDRDLFEPRYITMDVSYKNDGSQAKKYLAGELKIKVNGIGTAYRAYNKKATDIAADMMGSTTKEYKWSYRWDEDSDIYTFVNNEDIDVGTAGSFEIIWKYTASETKNNYSNILSASFYDNNDSLLLKSNDITYSETRYKKMPEIEASFGLSKLLISEFDTSSIVLDDTKYYVGSDFKMGLYLGSSGLREKGLVPLQDNTIIYTVGLPSESLLYNKDKKIIKEIKEIDGFKYYTIPSSSLTIGENVLHATEGMYVFYPCDKKYDSNNNLVGYEEKVVDIQCKAKGVYYEDDYYTDFPDKETTFYIQPRTFLEYDWADRLWTSFGTMVTGTNSKDMHPGSWSGSASDCKYDQGWVSPKTMYSKNDYDLVVTTSNSWIDGHDGSDVSLDDNNWLELRWYKGDDGNNYAKFRMSWVKYSNISSATLTRRADSIQDIVDIINNEVNYYTSGEYTDLSYRRTYTAEISDTDENVIVLNWVFSDSPYLEDGTKSSKLDPGEMFGSSVKNIDGLCVTYDYIFAGVGVRKDGSIYKYSSRILDDEEYSWKSITLPKASNMFKMVAGEKIYADCKIKIYGRYKGTKDYSLLDTRVLSDEEEVYFFPENICGVKIAILKANEENDYKMYDLFKTSLKVDLHLDKSKNTEDCYVLEEYNDSYNAMIWVSDYYSYYINGEEKDLKDSNYFATNNYSYGLSSNSEELWVYTGDDKVFGYSLNQIDTKYYGKNVTRTTPKVDTLGLRNYNRALHVHTLKNKISSSLSFGSKGELSDSVTKYNADLEVDFDCFDKETPLTKFSVSMILAESCFIDNRYLSPEGVLKISKISFDSKNDLIDDISKYVKVVVKKDYKNCIYLRYDFDFSTNDGIFIDGNTLKISIPIQRDKLSKGSNSTFKFTDKRNDYKNLNNTVIMGVVVYDNMLLNYNSSGYKRVVPDINDIDDNGNTSETAYFNYHTFSEDTLAQEYFRKATIQSKTQLNPYYTEEDTTVELGKDIYYRLGLSPESSEYYYGIDFTWMFKDSDWVGSIKELGRLTIYNNSRGFLPRLFYTYSDNPNEEDWVEITYPYSNIPEGNIKGIRYFLSDKDVADFKVAGSAISYITMSAPSSEEYVGKFFKAKFTAKYLLEQNSDNWRVLESNEISTKLVDGLGNLRIHKTDSFDNKPLADASFSIYNKDDSLYLTDLKSDANGEVLVSNIPYGDYYIKEDSAPKGYICSENKKFFTISSDNWVDIFISNDRKKGTVELTKECEPYGYYNINGEYVEMYSSYPFEDKFLKGAVFELYDSNDTLIKEGITTDEDGKATIPDLNWGSYYLKEVKAPDYYVITEDALEVSFDVTRDNVDTPIQLTVYNGQKPAKIRVEAYEVDTNGNLSSTPIKNIEFSLSDAISITNKDGVAFEGVNFGFGEHDLSCLSLPEGYVKPEDVKVTLTEKNCDEPLVVKVGIKRKTGTIKFYKENDKGNLVPNAKYGLYKEDGTLVSTAVTNEKGYALFENLEWGIKYYLQELEAPSGHSLNDEKYYVDVKADNVRSDIVLSVRDDILKGNVTLFKTDYTTGEAVPEAVYNVYKLDGTLVLEDLKTGSDGKLIAKDLEWGTYYFKETTAPSGYCLSDEKVYFSVNYETILSEQVITAEDIKKVDNTIRISKEIPIVDLNYAQGNPTFLYKISGVTKENKELGYSASIVFDKDSVDSYLSENPNSDVVVLTVNIPVAEKGLYTVVEQNVIRYADNKIKGINNGTDLGNSRVSFDIKGNVNFGEVTFSSSKLVNSGLSSNAHSRSVVSVAEIADKPMNRLVATYSEDVLSTETIDRDKLIVYMQYTDGTKKDLLNDDYSLSKETFDLSKYSDNTVYVTYTEEGKTYKTSFNITVVGSSEFSYHELDDGTLAIDGYLGNDTTVYFPSEINGKKVSSIVSNKLDDYGNLESISGLENVTEIIISDEIEYIGDKAFYCVHTTGNYSDPMTVTLGKGLKRIGNYAFNQNRVNYNDIYLTDCEYVGQYAFAYGIQNFKAITIKGVNIQIGSYAFYDIRTSGDLIIGGKNVVIDSNAFYYMNRYTIGENGYNYVYNKYPKNISIKGVSSINSSAFSYANCLNLNIEGTGEGSKIGYNAFSDLCDYLYNAYGYNNEWLYDYFKNNKCSIEIRNIEYIDPYAFYGSRYYMGDVKIDGINTVIGNYAFEYFGNYMYGYEEKSTTLSLTGSFKSIGEHVFSETCFTDADLSGISNETVLNRSFFSYSGNLSKVTGASGITSYPEYCFCGCSKLQSVEGFKEDAIISEGAFEDTPFEQTLRDKGLIE